MGIRRSTAAGSPFLRSSNSRVTWCAGSIWRFCMGGAGSLARGSRCPTSRRLADTLTLEIASFCTRDRFRHVLAPLETTGCGWTAEVEHGTSEQDRVVVRLHGTG